MPLDDVSRDLLNSANEKLEETVALLNVIHSPMPGHLGLLRWSRTERKREKQVAALKAIGEFEETETPAPS